MPAAYCSAAAVVARLAPSGQYRSPGGAAVTANYYHVLINNDCDNIISLIIFSNHLMHNCHVFVCRHYSDKPRVKPRLQ